MDKISDSIENLKGYIDEEIRVKLIKNIARYRPGIILDDKLLIGCAVNVDLADNAEPLPDHLPIDEMCNKLVGRYRCDTLVRLVAKKLIAEKYMWPVISRLKEITKSSSGKEEMTNQLGYIPYQANYPLSLLKSMAKDTWEWLNTYAILLNKNVGPEDFIQLIKDIPGNNISYSLRGFYPLYGDEIEDKDVIEKLLMLMRKRSIYPAMAIYSVFKGQYHYPELYTKKDKEMLYTLTAGRDCNEFFIFTKDHPNIGLYDYPLGCALKYHDRRYLNSKEHCTAKALPGITALLTMLPSEYDAVKGTLFHQEMMRKIAEEKGPIVIPDRQDYRLDLWSFIKDAVGDQLVIIDQLWFDSDVNTIRNTMRKILELKIHVSKRSVWFHADTLEDKIFQKCGDLPDYDNNEDFLVSLLIEFGHEYMAGIDFNKIRNKHAQQRARKYLTGCLL